MNIDSAIAKNEFFAILVLPLEFDARRSPISFRYMDGHFVDATQSTELSIAPFHAYTNNSAQDETPREVNALTIQSALQAIERGELEKVVVSCIKHAPRTNQSLDSIFHRLNEHYPNTLVYALHHPEFGTWIGATPELLLHKKGQHFHTVSLAGTQAYSDTRAISWNDKLRREQSLVTDFIVQTITQWGATDIELNGPFTAQAGPLAHLKTDIRFSGTSDAKQLIAELQPTPAVCGLPRQAALNFLNAQSTTQRRLYAGTIGLRFNSGDELHFVNLRCMQVFDDHFELHVGGGVVAGSSPGEEWQETEMKADVLRRFLQ
ncbi:MAG: hypothetical protein RL040_1393 [Bacteroidota bacterium]|jgi:isochorismate synthase